MMLLLMTMVSGPCGVDDMTISSEGIYLSRYICFMIPFDTI